MGTRIVPPGTLSASSTVTTIPVIVSVMSGEHKNERAGLSVHVCISVVAQNNGLKCMMYGCP